MRGSGASSSPVHVSSLCACERIHKPFHGALDHTHASAVAWTAAELARTAGVAPSTATEHLNLLVSGGLLAEERLGRHRYLRLADDAAELIERLTAAALMAEAALARELGVDLP
ncbi:DNA-binding transcriptional ArsR family regulator [Jiangella mangrovi]|uniref:DNA-binding transcriptional ArsR family regulator n=1 Tax=Jiangella mangrovi TaxID=1524084 RepID=A0A7W9GM19_9ACTN|nr:winged helix-turn-helix domain-containing protein [Jiangella mangrovi]MBB5786158.1 DNA-binding transcriptional ArsR family regulator [Jiangella mangrovi]